MAFSIIWGRPQGGGGGGGERVLKGDVTPQRIITNRDVTRYVQRTYQNALLFMGVNTTFHLMHTVFVAT